jgi:hypothetical protein
MLPLGIGFARPRWILGRLLIAIACCAKCVPMILSGLESANSLVEVRFEQNEWRPQPRFHDKDEMFAQCMIADADIEPGLYRELGFLLERFSEGASVYRRRRAQ